MAVRDSVSFAIDGEARSDHRCQIAIAVDGRASGDLSSTLVLISRHADGTVRCVKSCTVGYRGILPGIVYSLAYDGTIVPYEELNAYEDRLRAEAHEAEYQAERDA